MAYQTIRLGEGKSKIEVSFDETSRIIVSQHDKESNSEHVISLDPAELQIIVAAYNAFIRYKHNWDMRDLEKQKKWRN